MRNLLLIDVGATWTRIGRSNGQRLLSVQIVPTKRRWSSAKRQLIPEIAKLFAGRKITQVVIGVPGTVNAKRTRLIAAPNLDGWARQPIVADLRFITRAPVMMENDAALGGLGEARFGAGRKFQTIAYVTVGTGVGGARIIRRRIDRVAQRFQPGQLKIVPGRTLERLIGGRWLSKRKVVWAEVTKWLAFGLQRVAMRWPSDIVVVGGGVVDQGRISWPLLRRLCKPDLRPIPSLPRPVKGRLGPLAGLYGAMELAMVKDHLRRRNG